MEIHRAEHRQNFTVISNHLIKDNRLSEKARLFLIFVLSLPEDWNFSVSGIAVQFGKSPGAIRRLLQELEEYGYLIRRQNRNEDGFLYCGKGHTRKQYRLVNGGKEYVVPILCKCGAEQRDKEEAEFKRWERMAELKRQKAACIHDSSLLYATFENDDGTVPMMRAARKYVETWQICKANNDGLLLYGEVGTRKTFFAGCIANALIEQGVLVFMTNFAKILNSVTGMYSEERNNFIASLMRYNLLSIDDLGIERNSEFALEQIYNIIDERYKTRLPLIVTTNLSLKSLENPKDVAHQRIYDRVLSMCTPVRFVGTSHRKMDAMKKHKALAELFDEE